MRGSLKQTKLRVELITIPSGNLQNIAKQLQFQRSLRFSPSTSVFHYIRSLRIRFSPRTCEPTNCPRLAVAKVFNVAARAANGKPPQNGIWKVELGDSRTRAAALLYKRARSGRNARVLSNLPSCVILCAYALLSGWQMERNRVISRNVI